MTRRIEDRAVSRLRATVEAGALCKETDPELFYRPEGRNGAHDSTVFADAKQVCAACPVRALCLDLALVTDERQGVWGGLTDQERLTLRPAYRAAAFARISNRMEVAA